MDDKMTLSKKIAATSELAQKPADAGKSRLNDTFVDLANCGVVFRLADGSRAGCSDAPVELKEKK